MAKQTAVRWLLENIQKVNKMDWDILFIAAQQMEKEQIMNAIVDWYTKDFESAEQYYNETYGTEG